MVILFSIVIIFGFLLNIPLLQGDIFGSPSTKLNTALIFLVLGISTYLLNVKRENKDIQTIIKIVSLIVFLTGFLTLIQYFFQIGLPTDQLFISSSIDDLTPTRTRFLSSLIFLFWGVSLYFFTIRKYIAWAQIMVFLGGLISYVGFITYLFDLGSIHYPNFYSQMALFTSMIHILLCVSLLLVCPTRGIMKALHQDSPGAYMGRIMLPSSVIVLSIAGLLVTWGEKTELYNSNFGEVLLLTITIGFLFAIILWLAQKLNQLDRSRKKFENRIINVEQFFEDIINGIVEGILVINKENRVRYLNQGMLNIFGIMAEDVVNRSFENDIITQAVPEINNYYHQAKEQLRPVFIDSLELNYSSEKLYLSGWIIPQIEDDKFSGAIITASDVTITKKAEKVMKDSLREKELLLGEVHHRVKNNMQIISSLLRLQSAQVDDEEAQNLFLESQNRIRTMSLVHESLYQSENFSKIDMLNYINRLVKNLTITYHSSSRVIFQVNSENIELAIDTAIPVGLIINELVTNAIKHAFPDNRSGKIYIRFKKEDDCYQLRVKDDGVGIPKDMDLSSTTSLGWELVNGLVNQLSGNLVLNRDDGTEIIINFKSIDYEPRI